MWVINSVIAGPSEEELREIETKAKEESDRKLKEIEISIKEIEKTSKNERVMK